MVMLDILVCLIILVTGFKLKNYFGFSNSDKRILNYLFFIHLFFGLAFVYINSSDGGGGDAVNFWRLPKLYGWEYVMQRIERGSASGYIYLINYFPSHVLNLSFFTGSMFYTQLGYAGFVLVVKIIKENIPNYQMLKRQTVFGVPLFPYMLYLPNIHFWTAGIGKDTILFFCIILFIYAVQNLKKRIIFFAAAISLSMFIRPHIVLFLFAAYVGALALDRRVKMYQKVFIYVICIGAFIVLIPKVLALTQMETLETESFENFSNSQAERLNTQGSDSGIDISNYSYPFKIFTFLFRPLFFDSNGLLAIFASFENVLLLIFFLIVLINKPLKAIKQGNLVLKSLFFFFCIGTMVFPLTLGNLGIILRQKTPFIIVFIIFGFWTISRKYSVMRKKTETKKVKISESQILN